uniref:Peptidase S1 domain-containing protein n=1 Tax=Heterorhabditis bacteriophora TaxID=37862 RepID=A0A1I7XU31_HETBA
MCAPFHRISPPVNMSNAARTICLPILPPIANKICVVAGWGMTSEHGRKSDVLREIHIPIVPFTECNNFAHYGGRIHLPSMVCAGYSQGSVDSCQGDSGGPLMCAVNGRWELHGLVSWGIGCGRPGHPGVYSMVHAALPWIRFEMFKLKQ